MFSKVALITGGASGIGLCAVKQFLDKSPQNKVCVADLRVDEKVRQELNQQYPKRVIFSLGDLTKKENLEQAFQQTAENFQQLDVVFNNAGIGMPEDVMACKTLDDVEKQVYSCQKVLDINLTAVIRGSYLGVFWMKKLGTKGGCIINVSSQGGIFPQGASPTYSASKHGVVGFTRSLAFLQKESGIRTNTICPSFIETPLVLDKIYQSTGTKVKEGELIAMNVAVHQDKVGEAFMNIIYDDRLQDEILGVVPPSRITKMKKQGGGPQFPGSHPRGGALVRVPSKEELKEFWTAVRQQKPKM